MEELVTISARIPKSLNSGLGRYTRRMRYTSKSEALREIIRQRVFGTIDALAGSAEGKAGFAGKSMSEWRREEWGKALKAAKGDARKAAKIIEKNELKALEGLRL